MADRVSIALWIVIILIGVPQSLLLYRMWDDNLSKQIDAWSEALPRSVLTSLVESDYIGAIPQLKLASSTGLFNCISIFNRRNEKILESGCSSVSSFMTTFRAIDVKDSEGEIWGRVNIEVNRAAFFMPLAAAVTFGWVGLFLLGLFGRKWSVTQFEKDFDGLTQRISNIVSYSIKVASDKEYSSHTFVTFSSRFQEEIQLEDAFQALAKSLVSFKNQVEKVH